MNRTPVSTLRITILTDAFQDQHRAGDEVPRRGVCHRLTPAMSDEPQSSLILYQTEDGQTKVEVRLVNETVWLSAGQMAELFQRDKSVVSRHISNIFAEGELRPESVVADFATTAADGKSYQVTYYNLDVIISVGYRVKSHRGTQFRIWATQRLREFIVKGFALDDERLKQGGAKNTYFDELLARIRDIRASERNFYQKVLEIYGTSLDYDPKAAVSHDFFAIAQTSCTGRRTGTPPLS